MARKKKQQEPEYIPAPVEEQAITKTLERNFMPYAMSVIIWRAEAEVGGLKPGHRGLLYTM